MEPKAITNISVSDNISLITVNNVSDDAAVLPKIFAAIAERGILVDMISLTPPYKNRMSLSFTIDNDRVSDAINLVGRFKEGVPDINCDINTDNSKIVVYGEAMKQTVGVAASVLDTIVSGGIEVKLITTAENEISLLVSDADVDPACKLLREQYLK